MQGFRDVWLVIPVFNEETVIAAVVGQALGTFPNIVCVDDGSRDGTAAALQNSGAHVLRHPINLGQGAALQTGLTYALSQPGAEYFVTFDADGQHQVEDVPRLIEPLRAGEADVALGSRFLDKTGEVPKLKQAVLRTASVLSGSSRKLKLTDAHNGLRAFNRVAASRLDITMNGMAHASEIVDFLASSTLRVREVPVTVLYTEYSQSKGQSLINGVNILFDLSVRQRGA